MADTPKPPLTNREKLLIIADNLDGFFSELEGANKCAKDDAKVLRQIVEEICPDGCDGG